MILKLYFYFYEKWQMEKLKSVSKLKYLKLEEEEKFKTKCDVLKAKKELEKVEREEQFQLRIWHEKQRYKKAKCLHVFSSLEGLDLNRLKINVTCDHCLFEAKIDSLNTYKNYYLLSKNNSQKRKRAKNNDNI